MEDQEDRWTNQLLRIDQHEIWSIGKLQANLISIAVAIYVTRLFFYEMRANCNKIVLLQNNSWIVWFLFATYPKKCTNPYAMENIFKALHFTGNIAFFWKNTVETTDPWGVLNYQRYRPESSMKLGANPKCQKPISRYFLGRTVFFSNFYPNFLYWRCETEWLPQLESWSFKANYI